MNLLEKKQLNLLVHLAKVDGRFEKSEHDLLKAFIKEKGLTHDSLDGEEKLMRFSDFEHSENKIELLYWALKMMHADKVIHEKEILFCKNLASKLGFNQDIISYFARVPLPDYELFEQEVKSIWATGL